MGLGGWGHDDGYLKRSEDNERLNDAYHAQGGPLGISDSRAMTPCVDVMIEAAEAFGLRANDDFNVGHNLQDHCMSALTFLTEGGTLESAFTPETTPCTEA
jgi:choline dehydrogenase-like flavoprotein